MTSRHAGSDEAAAKALVRARMAAARGEDEAAKQGYLETLRRDPACLDALIELGALAYASGHRSAARTAYAEAVRQHPGNPISHIGLANIMLGDGDACGARHHCEAALAAAPDFPEAHQALARALSELGDASAETHWQKGFSGHAVTARRYRGAGPAVPLLLLVAARGGNIATRQWIDDRTFAVTAVYTDFFDPGAPLPPHALVVNAIADADLCGVALERAEHLLARNAAPVINPPRLVRATGRAGTAQRLSGIPGVIAPATMTLPRDSVLEASALGFPLLLRTPGFHTGQNFVLAETRGALAGAAAGLPGRELLAIEYLNARGADGLARKYRVMFIGGVMYPLHLAIAPGWKVHYYTAAMADSAAHREEERRFLDGMPDVLGGRAMSALTGISAALGLDYAGVDFALSPEGSVLLFEANAAMVVNPPAPDEMWAYRRPAITNVLDAAKRMLLDRASSELPHLPKSTSGGSTGLAGVVKVPS